MGVLLRDPCCVLLLMIGGVYVIARVATYATGRFKRSGVRRSEEGL